MDTTGDGGGGFDLPVRETVPRIVESRWLRGLVVTVTGLLFLLIHVSAVLGCDLFGERFPQYFGTVGTSLFSMFQVMTLEGRAETIARPLMPAIPGPGVFSSSSLCW